MKDGKVYITDGEYKVQVNIYHWWPGKKWYSAFAPIPLVFITQAQEMGSKYLTFVEADLKNILDLVDPWFYAAAYCCPRDYPTRKMGREIALGRLRKLVESHGLSLTGFLD